LFKYNIGLPFILFAFLTIKQLIFNSTVEWVDNVGISIFVFLFYNIWEWLRKPHKEKKADS